MQQQLHFMKIKVETFLHLAGTGKHISDTYFMDISL